MVQVLMSTYNGEKYLKEQLDSLLNQSYKDIKILVRDDGSKDRTVEILDEYSKKYPEKIKCVYGDNIGVIASFLELINLSDDNYKYFAFCDQDDIWLKEKVEKAVEKMKDDIPFMYFSNKILVDEKLNVLKKENYTPEISLENSIIENLATGCTVVINKKLIDAVKNKKINKEKILMHDWVLFIIANMIGEIYFDSNAYIYYRQHSNNVVGIETNKIKKIKKRMKNLKNRKKDALKNQVLEILKIAEEKIEKEKYIKIFEIVKANNILQRYRMLMKNNIKRQNRQDDIIFKILYIFGWS